MIKALNSPSANLEKTQILVIDDNPNDLELLSEILTRQNYEVTSINNDPKAISQAQTDLAKLILVALNPPKMSGYQICQLLKAQTTIQDIPIIFVGASNDPLDKVKAFEVGASDYISKPFHPEEILLRVAKQLKIRETQLELYQLNEQLEKNIQERTAELEIANQKLQQQITQRKQAQDRLLKLALNDSVTGLPNRKSCLYALKQYLKNIEQTSDYQFAIFLIKCDLFQEIKCYLGHLASNQLLMEIARRLGSIVSENDFLGYFENNQFVIVLSNFTEQQELYNYTTKIQEKFKQPFTILSPITEIALDRQEMTISCSIGIVPSNKYYQTEHDLLQDAEIAVYQATQLGKGSYYLFESSLSSESYTFNQKNGHSPTKKIIKQALKEKKFLVYYQPIYALQDNQIVGFEALLRMQTNEKKLILPQDFFKTAEISNLSILLGDLVLQQACFQLKSLHLQHKSQQELFININLSQKQLLDPKLTTKIGIINQKYRIASKYIKFDITGEILINNYQSVQQALQDLYKSGLAIFIDDFADNIATLKKLPNSLSNNLKIDGSLIHKIDANNNNQSKNTIKQLIDLAHSKNMKVTAEGIETETQLNYLNSLGCDYGQGFLLSKPLAGDALEAFLLWQM